MQRRIWVVAFASFTTACVGFWAYAATQDRAATLRDVERQTVTTARLLEEQAERTFEAGGLLLSLLAEIGEPEVLRAPGAGQKAFERLRAAVESNPQIGAAWVLDAQGNSLLDSWSWPPKPNDGAQHGYFQEHKDGRRDLYIGPPEPGAGTSPNRFTLSRPLLDERGELEGVAVVAVHGRYFEGFYREAGLAPGSAIRLFTADGTVLAAWPAEASPEQDEGFALLVERLREGAPGTAFLTEHGLERLLAYRALTAVPLAVGVLAPLEPALAGWRGRTMRSGLVLAAALLGFGLLVAMGLKLAHRQRLALIELGQAKTSLEARVQERTSDLEQREAELRLIADAVPALVSYIDREERYRFVNKAYEDWFGHSRDAVLGRTVHEVVGDEAYEIAGDRVAKALAGEHVAYQTVLPYRDGGARYVDAQYIPHVGPDGRARGFYAFVVDMTERERSAAALRESEGRYRALAEAIAAVIWTTSPDGLVTDMPQWRAITGQTIEEVRGWGWLEALHPDDRARTAELWRRCVES
ncbi:MAG TPA: PAS domain S-box protein, partial [Geminicoccaceae bacterium]|nr:PAS domain S-box protein [Geminicoccaceae bacterium]